MLKTKSQKTVIAGLMLALGILLPFTASHGLGLFPGNIFLPMHIPVLLCGFFCGPVYGALCGLILPLLNSTLTGMPVMYPNAIIMSCELLTYGLFTGLLYKLSKHSGKLTRIYPVLLISMILGRIVYGLVATLLLFFNPAAGKLSVIAAIMQGIPGIIIQLILVPGIVFAVSKKNTKTANAQDKATDMIESGAVSCVVVKDNKIISAELTKGISHIIKLYEENKLEDAFVADTVIGKAAAMIFSLGGVKSCYGQTVSKSAVKWLTEHNIDVTYKTCPDYIINRKGDGMCPMEMTVKDIYDEAEALIKLKDKVAELSKTK